MIVNKHMDDLINMAPVYSNHGLRGLRQLYDLVDVHVRGVKAQNPMVACFICFDEQGTTRGTFDR